MVDLKEPVVVKIPPKLEPVKVFNAAILVFAEPEKLFSGVSTLLTPPLNVDELVSNVTVASPVVAPPLKPFPATTPVSYTHLTLPTKRIV